MVLFKAPGGGAGGSPDLQAAEAKAKERKAGVWQ